MESEKKDIIKDPKNISIFNNSGYNVFLYQKSQKLLAAIYLITDFLQAEEPLKWTLRNKAVLLFSANLSLTVSSTLERKKILDTILSLSLEIVALAEVAMLSRIISDMNFTILKNEFEQLIALIESREKDMSSREVVLSEDFLKTSEPYPPSYIGQINKGHNTVFNNASFTTPSRKPEASPLASIPRIISKTGSVKNPDHEFKGHAEKRVDKNDRQEAILSVIKKTGEVTIKDLTSVISDCSEKTIQRELLAMVAKGVLNKLGERRWSRYSLAQL